jgi:hypothetical protein
LPFFEVGRGDEGDAWWEGALDLCGGVVSDLYSDLVYLVVGSLTFTSSFCRRLLLIAAMLVIVSKIESRVVVVKAFR